MSAYEALAGVYDALTEDVGYERRADYLEKLFQKSRIPVHTVLDLACGTGGMTSVLTERGYELIGVDQSPDMLAAAQEKAAGLAGIPPVFICQSMPDLDLYGTVDAAICCLDSINYLTSQSLDGQVFLDEREDVYCVWRSSFEKRSGICSYWMDIFTRREDGCWSRAGEEHRQRAYAVDELRAWLLEAGFDRIRTYGDCRMSGPKEDAQRIYFSAIRDKG